MATVGAAAPAGGKSACWVGGCVVACSLSAGAEVAPGGRAL